MNGFGHTINSAAFDDWSDVEPQRASPRRPLSIFAAGFLVVMLLALGALAGTQHAKWAVGALEMPSAAEAAKAALAEAQAFAPAKAHGDVAVIATVAPGTTPPSR